MVFGLDEEDVNVVVHRIDFEQRRILISQDAGDVGVELIAFLIAQELAAAFGAEHEMNDDVGERLGHDSHALTGLRRHLGTGCPGPALAGLASAQADTLRAFSPGKWRMDLGVHLSKCMLIRVLCRIIGPFSAFPGVVVAANDNASLGEDALPGDGVRLVFPSRGLEAGNHEFPACVRLVHVV